MDLRLKHSVVFVIVVSLSFANVFGRLPRPKYLRLLRQATGHNKGPTPAPISGPFSIIPSRGPDKRPTPSIVPNPGPTPSPESSSSQQQLSLAGSNRTPALSSGSSPKPNPLVGINPGPTPSPGIPAAQTPSPGPAAGPIPSSSTTAGPTPSSSTTPGPTPSSSTTVGSTPSSGPSPVPTPADEVDMLVDKFLSLSGGTDYVDGDPCDPEVEEHINNAIMATRNYDPIETTLGHLRLADQLMGGGILLCNRSRLIVCNNDTMKCACAPLTDHREMTYLGIKSYFCYLTAFPCDQDVAVVIPVFEKQEEIMHAHYGHPQYDVDDDDGCLTNLCVTRNPFELKCESQGYYDFSL